MDRDTLVLGIAAVFAGTFVLMTILALSHSLFLLIVALPFGAAAYFMWWQISGKMEDRFRGRARDPDADARRRAAEARQRAAAGGDGRGAAEGAPGGNSRFAEEARRRAERGEGPFADGFGRERGRGEQFREGRFGGQRADGRGRGRGGRGRSGRGPGTAGSAGMPASEAYDALDIERGASQDSIKSAYREKVKEVHPDSGGDEEAFKRVNRAYETLREE